MHLVFVFFLLSIALCTLCVCLFGQFSRQARQDYTENYPIICASLISRGSTRSIMVIDDVTLGHKYLLYTSDATSTENWCRQWMCSTVVKKPRKISYMRLEYSVFFPWLFFSRCAFVGLANSLNKPHKIKQTTTQNTNWYHHNSNNQSKPNLNNTKRQTHKPWEQTPTDSPVSPRQESPTPLWATAGYTCSN